MTKSLIRPNEYKLSEEITPYQLQMNGFEERGDRTYRLRRVLYSCDNNSRVPYVVLNVTVSYIDNLPHLINTVGCIDGSTYPPFYNPGQVVNNLVCEKVIRKYNEIMDLLVKNKVLKIEDRKKGDETVVRNN